MSTLSQSPRELQRYRLKPTRYEPQRRMKNANVQPAVMRISSHSRGIRTETVHRSHRGPRAELQRTDTFATNRIFVHIQIAPKQNRIIRIENLIERLLVHIAE